MKNIVLDFESVNEQIVDVQIDSKSLKPTNSLLSNDNSSQNFKPQVVEYSYITKPKDNGSYFESPKKEKIYPKCTLEEFIKKVEEEQTKGVYSIIYRNSTVVRPYFDIDKEIDCYNAKEKKEVLNYIKNLLCTEFKVKSTQLHIADNSRQKEDKYKISFHVFVEGIKTTQKDLFKFVTYLHYQSIEKEKKDRKEDKEISKINNLIFDTKVYRPNKETAGVFRFSNQKKVPSDKKAPKILSSDLSQYVLCNVQDDDKFYYCPYDPIATKNNIIEDKKAKTNNKKYQLQFNNMKLTEAQIKEIRHILNKLPLNYADDYELWRNIGFSLHNFSNTKECLELYKEFSKRSAKYNESEVDYFWSKFKNEGLTIGTLLKYAKDNKIRYSKYKFGRNERINLLDGIEDIGVNITRFNNRYVDYSKGFVKPKDCTLIISPTGSGKTQFIKDMMQQDKYKGKKIISLVSRQSMAYQHSQQFNIGNYKKDEWDHINGCVLCIDSLDKLHNIKYKAQEYILIIDEINSVIVHTLNPLDKMRTNRLEFIEKIFDLIDESLFTIGVDADLTTNTINYINSNTLRDVNVFINEFKDKNKKQCTIYQNKDNLIKQLIEDFKNDKYFYVCSDDLGVFEKEVFLKLKHKFEDDYPDKVKKMVFYAGNGGHNDAELSTLKDVNKSWKDKFVFTTPKIIYGIDYSLKDDRNVYGFYYGRCLNACHIMQQLARIRHPESINLWFQASTYCPIYYGVEDVKAQFNKLNSKNHYGVLNNNNDKLINNYKNYIYQIEYMNDVLMNIQWYVLDMLRQKDFMIKFEKEKFKLDIKLSEETKFKYIKERYEENKGKNSSIGEHIEAVTMTMKKINNIAILATGSNTVRNTYDNIRKIRGKNKLYHQSVADIKEGNARDNINQKFILMDALHKALNIEWFDVDYRKHKKENDEVLDFDSYNDMKVTFRIRKKEDPNSYNDYIKTLLDCYKGVFPDIMECDRIQKRVDGKMTAEKVKKINKIKLQEYNDLIDESYDFID